MRKFSLEKLLGERWEAGPKPFVGKYPVRVFWWGGPQRAILWSGPLCMETPCVRASRTILLGNWLVYDVGGPIWSSTARIKAPGVFDYYFPKCPTPLLTVPFTLIDKTGSKRVVYGTMEFLTARCAAAFSEMVA